MLLPLLRPSRKLPLLLAAAFAAGFLFGHLRTWGRCTLPVLLAGPAHGNATRKLRASLLVAIFSSRDNDRRRQIIRDTWLTLARGRDVAHVFVLGHASGGGTRLREEAERHGDLLILEGVPDSFGALSEKLRGVIRWAELSADFKILLKVDDDSFVRLDAFVEAAAQMPQRKLYWGYFEGRAQVKRAGKWAEPKWFLCDRYLPYARGGGYALSADVVLLLASVSAHLSLYRNEDVTLGVWTAPMELQRMHDPRFDTEFASRGCSDAHLVSHKMSHAHMEERMRNLAERGRLCTQETRLRDPYSYNWDVLPSQCCERGVA